MGASKGDGMGGLYQPPQAGVHRGFGEGPTLIDRAVRLHYNSGLRDAGLSK